MIPSPAPKPPRRSNASPTRATPFRDGVREYRAVQNELRGIFSVYIALGQHRTIWQEHSAKDFASYESYKRAGILYVFPPFITARMGQKIGRRPQTQLCGAALDQATSIGFDLDKIKKSLSQMVDISSPKIADELIEEFVEVITPVENHHYRWKMCFGKRKAPQERSNLMKPENPPVLTFTIDFEAARQFRYSNGLPAQFRKRDWHDLTVEVYL